MELLRGRAPGRSAEPSAAAESWFLGRGLPFVLTRRARWRRLWTRSSPMLAAYAALQACILAVYLITGGHDIEISGEPTTSELLIHMTLFLGALTFMYISARAAGDAEYRSTFLDPLIDDMGATLVARNRYYGATRITVRRVDGAETSD